MFTAYQNVQVKQTTAPGRFFCNHFYPTFRGNASRREEENEPHAVKCLVDMGVVVKKSGMTAREVCPWFSASPESILNDA